MSYMFEKEFEVPADRDGDEPELAPHSLDPGYHDYLATYRSLGDTSRRTAVVWSGVVLAVLVVAVLGVAAFLYVGG